MEITELKNETEVDEDGISQIHERWRSTLFGSAKLLCPYCSCWFSLGKDFKIDDTGMVSDVVYHICDKDDDEGSEFESSEAGWVVLPKLIGWKE